MNQGVRAYKDGKYEEAIGHFNKSVSLDPSLGVARLYLATAYRGQFVPGVDDPGNIRTADQAIDQFQKTLELDPTSGLTHTGLGWAQTCKSLYEAAIESLKKGA